MCNSSTKLSFRGANHWAPCMLDKSSPRCAASQSHKSPEQRLLSGGATGSTKSQPNLTLRLSAPRRTARPKVGLWKAGACLSGQASRSGLRLLPPGSAACVFCLSQFQNCYQPWVLHVLLLGTESRTLSQLHSLQPGYKLHARLLGGEDRSRMIPLTIWREEWEQTGTFRVEGKVVQFHWSLLSL